MHLIAATPSAKCLKALDAGDLTQFADMSQILYWYASSLCMDGDMVRSAEDGTERFDIGSFVDFEIFAGKDSSDVMAFEVESGCEFPSIPLNSTISEAEDVGDRGRLKFSSDSIDFFSGDGEAGYSASRRIRGVVLHDILSRVEMPSDLKAAVDVAVRAGELTAMEAE